MESLSWHERVGPYTATTKGHFYGLWMRDVRLKLVNSLVGSSMSEQGKGAQLKCALLSSDSGWENAPTFHVSHYPHCKTFVNAETEYGGVALPQGLFISLCCDYGMLYNLVLTEVESKQSILLYTVSYTCSRYAPSCRSCKSARTRWNSPLCWLGDDGCGPCDEDVAIMCRVFMCMCGSAHVHCVQGSGHSLDSCL